MSVVPEQLSEWRRDPLVRNSFFLMATTALGAGSGFLFWLVVARFYPTAQVGQASSLLSCVALLSYFSLFGFSNALVRYLPTSAHRAQDTSTAICSVVVCGVVVSLTFAVVGPWFAGDLGFVRSSLPHLGLFVLLACGAAVNLLTDSIFLAARAAGANLVINGIFMSVIKLALPIATVAFGAFGIFAASGIASTLAAAISLGAIRRSLRIPVRLEIAWASLRRMVRYSMTSYLSGSLNIIPQIALPIIVLHHLGPIVAAVYFMALQISNLICAVSYAVGESLFAEGSHESRDLRTLAVRSGGLMLGITGAAVLVVISLARPILRLFGDDYARIGTTTLIIFAATSLAVAFHTWTSFLLRVTCQMRALVLSDVVFVAVILAVALYKVPDGLDWAPIAWGAGNLVAGVVAAAALRKPGQP
jgi:O-antigen/teichoic acid export membrane protein